MKKIILLTIFVVCLFGINVFGQKGTVVEKVVKFAKGKNSATVKGTVASRLDSHIFYVKAKQGQTLTVLMSSSKPLKDAYLCVIMPAGSDDTSYCNKRKYSINLPVTGNYEIYIEAIREPIPYTITITIK